MKTLTDIINNIEKVVNNPGARNVDELIDYINNRRYELDVVADKIKRDLDNSETYLSRAIDYI